MPSKWLFESGFLSRRNIDDQKNKRSCGDFTSSLINSMWLEVQICLFNYFFTFAIAQK